MIKLVIHKLGVIDLINVWKVLKNRTLTQGPYVSLFEEKLKTYLNCENLITTTSCTTALHLALDCLDLKVGDEVIVPDYTFPATINAVLQTKATPIICDVNSKTYSIDVENLKNSLTNNTKAVIVVHPFGLCTELEEIMVIATNKNIVVIEDAACALGSSYNGKKAGTFGHFGAFSFHPRKIITTGEGGALVINDPAFKELAKIRQNHGSTSIINSIPNRIFISHGYNYRMSDLNAAIGLKQITKIDRIVKKRREKASKFNQKFLGMKDIILQQIPEKSFFNYQSYVIRFKNQATRNFILKYLREQNIDCTIGTYALSEQPAYLKYVKTPPINSKELYETSLTIPLHGWLTRKDIKKITDKILIKIQEIQSHAD